jgi:hypothetical protein
MNFKEYLNEAFNPKKLSKELGVEFLKDFPGAVFAKFDRDNKDEVAALEIALDAYASKSGVSFEVASSGELMLKAKDAFLIVGQTPSGLKGKVQALKWGRATDARQETDGKPIKSVKGKLSKLSWS